jgi:HlyD family secretion protein
MQVWISVNEADIGSIHPGQQVSFTVDAYPNRVFEGKVGKIRLNATMTQNVVTYTVEVNADNSDGTLLPYLTANAQFLTSEQHGVLLVPNAALRWRPPPDLIAPAFSRSSSNRSDKSASRDGRAKRGWPPSWHHVDRGWGVCPAASCHQRRHRRHGNRGARRRLKRRRTNCLGTAISRGFAG